MKRQICNFIFLIMDDGREIQSVGFSNVLTPQEKRRLEKLSIKITKLIKDFNSKIKQ